MELDERIADVRRRPGVYGISTLGEMIAFLVGIDAANDWCFLKEFQRWLGVKLNLGANLTLPVLVVAEAYPDADSEFRAKAIHEESPEAMAVLFDELGAFLESDRLRG